MAASKRSPIIAAGYTGAANESGWYVYILECADRSFYTGATNDPATRLALHNRGRASRYTRARLPARLIYLEHVGDRSAALRRECAIKALTRAQKGELVAAAERSEQRIDPPKGS